MFNALAKCLLLSALPIVYSGIGVAQSLEGTCRERLSEHPITVIVPNVPGGGYDTYARTFAPFLGDVIGTDVRVTNMPGGGGLLAATAVARQGDDEILLLLDDLSDLVINSFDGRHGVTVADFAPLGMVLREPRVWLGRPGLDLGQRLVASAPTLDSSVVEIGMAARAVGIDVQVIAGYEGSGEQAAAVLRGETDFTAQSLGTALRNAAGNDLEIALVIADAPSPRLPDTPALGDLIRAAGDQGDPTIGEIAIALGVSYRALVTAETGDDDVLACLRAATDLALVLPEFAAEAAAQGRLVDPVLHEETIAAYGSVVRAWGNFEHVARSILEETSP